MIHLALELVAAKMFLVVTVSLIWVQPLPEDLLKSAGCDKENITKSAVILEEFERCTGRGTISHCLILADEQEPGTHIKIGGRLLAEDGVTPLPHILMFVYHADADGYYSPGGADERTPRISGILRTDDGGRYEIRTILPGGYPNSKIPSHIHVSATLPDGRELWLEEFFFDDDPRLQTGFKRRLVRTGRFSPIVTLMKNTSGELIGSRDFRVPVKGKNIIARTHGL